MKGRTRVLGLLLAVLLSTAGLVACGSASSSNNGGGSGTNAPASVTSTANAAGDAEANAPCPTNGNTRAFAKTRFALHAGLAVGAFHRYIYKPLRNGGFQAGADKRIRTFAKAAIAGAFVVHELKVAKGFAEANPTLCNAIQSVTDKFSSITDRLKNGSLSPADLDGGETSLADLRGQSQSSGYNFSEVPATVPGAS